jgi:hypothetical protein
MITRIIAIRIEVTRMNRNSEILSFSGILIFIFTRTGRIEINPVIDRKRIFCDPVLELEKGNVMSVFPDWKNRNSLDKNKVMKLMKHNAIILIHPLFTLSNTRYNVVSKRKTQAKPPVR